MSTETIEIPISGMDCAGCARTIKHAIADLPGVESVEVLLTAERAMVEVDRNSPTSVDTIANVVEAVGYTVPKTSNQQSNRAIENSFPTPETFSRRVFWLFGLIFGAVLVVIVAGEWFGLLRPVSEKIPWPVGIGLVILVGYPVFKQVARATVQRQVIAHTLMTVGALAALIVGEWVTAVIVVFFMRVGDYAEQFTTQRARESVRRLSRLAPETARVERDGQTKELPLDQVKPGDIVRVHPGERIPVDGEVLSGRATINPSAITGESMPVEAETGTEVFAATIAQLGTLRIRATRIGRDSTFGRVIQMVEEAEARRGPVQRMADRFSVYYLPVVVLIAGLTYAFSQNLMATVAVLVVACSCAFALATPVAMLASIGAAARQGLLIKGGKYLEALAKTDVLLLDKTGTLTRGEPEITDIIPLDGISGDELLALAASAERHSEHPLGKAICRAARDRELPISEPDEFEAVPGQGIRAKVGSRKITVGNRQLTETSQPISPNDREALGQTLIHITIDGTEAGLLAAADRVRPEVPEALEALHSFGIDHIELLTGDNERVAAALADSLDLKYRAELLPKQKIEIVRQFQEAGRTVVMIGDGVNDAPALAQADVGIAMGAAGTDVAIDAAHIALMRDDWSLVPELFHITDRTMKVVTLNIGFTALYNVAGLTLATLGILPPILAAAAQSLPDLGILANSARLLRQ